MRIALILLLTASTACADFPLRVQKYLLDNDYAQCHNPWRSVSLFSRNGVDTVIECWHIPGIPKPTAQTLPTEQEAQVFLLPEKYRKKVGGKWVEKTPAEKAAADAAEQAAKPAKLKRTENKQIKFFRDEAIIPEEKTVIEPADITNMIEHLADLPDPQADNKWAKYERNMDLIEKLGGSQNDIHWHDDI